MPSVDVAGTGVQTSAARRTTRRSADAVSAICSVTANPGALPDVIRQTTHVAAADAAVGRACGGHHPYRSADENYDRAAIRIWRSASGHELFQSRSDLQQR